MKVRQVLTVATASLLAATACSSSSSPTTATSGSSPSAGSEVEAAKQVADPFLKPVTAIDFNVPLKEKPATGKKVVWLEGNNGGAGPITPGFKAGTAALGWTLKILSYDPADPQSASSAMQQAVAQKPDFIASSGLEANLLGQGFQAAKAAGIPVFQIATLDKAEGAKNGIYSVINRDDQIKVNSEAIADYVIADSAAKAKVALVTLPDYKVLANSAGYFKDGLTSGCSACSYDQVNVSLQDFVGGAVPSQVVSYLQTHPDVNYLMIGLGALTTGLEPALKAAGLDTKVKIVGAAPGLANAQALIDGTNAAWITLPEALQAWYVLDAMARHSEGMDLTPIQTAMLPTEIWTTTNVPKPASLYDGPADYAATWKTLWKLS